MVVRDYHKLPEAGELNKGKRLLYLTMLEVTTLNRMVQALEGALLTQLWCQSYQPTGSEGLLPIITPRAGLLSGLTTCHLGTPL